jgi:hypothetical protein
MVATRQQRAEKNALLLELSEDLLGHVSGFLTLATVGRFGQAAPRAMRKFLKSSSPVLDRIVLQSRGTTTVYREVRRANTTEFKFEESLHHLEVIGSESEQWLGLEDGVVHHGVVSLDVKEYGEEAFESVAVVSLAGAAGRRVPFVVQTSDRNICDAGCWCAGMATVVVDCYVNGAWTRLVIYQEYSDNAAVNEPKCSLVDADAVAPVVAALGLPANGLGQAVCTVVLAANLGREGALSWNKLASLATGANQYYWEYDQSDDVNLDQIAQFPFEMGADAPTDYFGSPSSPRGLLDQVKAAVVRRVVDASPAAGTSLGALHRCLAGWKSEVAEVRKALAMAEAKADDPCLAASGEIADDDVDGWFGMSRDTPLLLCEERNL